MRKKLTRPIEIIDFEDLKSGLMPESVAESVVQASSLDPLAVLRVVQNFGIQHVVQTDSPSYKDELKTAAILIQEKDRFFKYPLSSICHPDKTDLASEKKLQGYEYCFTSGSEKEELLDGLIAYLEQFTKRQAVLRDARVVADELFTNAVYNAPFVSNAAGQNSGPSRNRLEITMGEGQSGRLFAGCHGELLVLGCEDSYGTLNLASLLERIARCYIDGPAQVINLNEAGGAGIGSYLVYSITSSYFALVEENQRTLICCTMDYKRRERERKSIGKNVHFLGYSKK